MIANTCFFRSFTDGIHRKALLQITEVCNLRCVHCFISAGDYGETMSFEVIQDIVLPRLVECRVGRVTLTGGEPFKHPDVVRVAELFSKAGIRVGICTNATLIDEFQMESLVKIGNVHINISLDGFSPESHDKFRGVKDVFDVAIKNIKQLSKYGILQGFLVTPNTFAQVSEYSELCQFAIENKAKYVLMNPLSNLGRGVKSKKRISAPNLMMREIKLITECFKDSIQIVYVRFPNDELPLDSCRAGNTIYVFVRGELTVCPYLVFATNTLASKYNPSEFVVGNILQDADIASKLDVYNFQKKYCFGNNNSCNNCSLVNKCGKGCPVSIVSSGGLIGEIDSEVCPFVKHN